MSTDNYIVFAFYDEGKAPIAIRRFGNKDNAERWKKSYKPKHKKPFKLTIEYYGSK